MLIPLEEEAEKLGGILPDDTIAKVKSEATAAGLTGGLHATEYGGQGWSAMEWFLVEEQLGRSTNAISWHIPNAYNVWDHASPELAERWLKPALRGEIRDAYAVTEETAGSDPSGIQTRAVRSDNGFVINGEKWFVTSGDVAYGPDRHGEPDRGRGRRSRPCSWSTSHCPGIETIDDPAFTHSYPDGHPTIRFTDVEVGPGRRHRRGRRRRRTPEGLVRRGTPRYRGPRHRFHVAPARRDGRVGDGT